MAERPIAPCKPVASFIWPEADERRSRLFDAIAQTRVKAPDGKLGVGGTWASSKGLFYDQTFAPLVRWFHTLLTFDARDLDGWAVIMEPGDDLKPHDHRLSHHGGTNETAGAYYLKAGDPFWFEWEGVSTCIKPCAGMCLVFPAALIHWVPEVTEQRTVISWNAR